MRFILLFLCLSAPFYSHASTPIIIGLDADMSAVAKEGGIAIQRGAEIAIAEINTNGGVLNRPLKLITKNHRGNPARGIHNINQFAQENDLVAVIGGVHTPVALKELPAIHKNKIIYLDPWAAGTPIVDNGYQPNFVFRISVRDAEAAKVMISHAKKRGFKKVSLLLERTGWGRSNEKSLTASAQELGIEIVEIVWINWGQKTFKTELNRIGSSEAEAIILVANAPEGANVALNMLTQEKILPIISHWGIAGGNFIDRVGTEKLAQLDLSVLQTYSFTNPTNKKTNQKVLTDYQTRYGEKYTPKSLPGAVGTAHAYDLVHLLAAAIESAGTINRSVVRDELEKIPYHLGLVKAYQPAFTPERHDALLSNDYIMSTFDNAGHLVPIKE